MATPRVVEVYGGGGVGGAIRHLALLLERLPREGLSVEALSMPPHALVPVARAAGVPVSEVANIRAATRWLRDHPCDVVHSHGLRPALAALRARPARWVRTVHSLLGSDYTDPLRQAAARLSERRIVRRVDMTIAISQAVAADRLHLGADPSRLRVVWNGVEPAPAAISRPELCRLTGFPAEARVAMVVSRLERVKGVDLAVAMLSHLDPQWHLLVRGQGREEAALRAEATRLGVAGRFALLPYEQGVRREMGTADVVVVPSRQDGFSLVAVEAQAAGVPVVAAAVGGLTEAVVGGLLVMPEAGALAAGVREAYARRAELGERGRGAYQHHFTTQRFGQETAAVLREVAVGRGPSR